MCERDLQRERDNGKPMKLWLSTLASTLLGLLLILVLLLSFGPCILNQLVHFIKKRPGTIQLMVQRIQI